MSKELKKLKFEPGDKMICVDPVLLRESQEVLIAEGTICDCAGNTHFPDGSSYISVWMGVEMGTVITTDNHFELYVPEELQNPEVTEEE